MKTLFLKAFSLIDSIVMSVSQFNVVWSAVNKIKQVKCCLKYYFYNFFKQKSNEINYNPQSFIHSTKHKAKRKWNAATIGTSRFMQAAEENGEQWDVQVGGDDK